MVPSFCCRAILKANCYHAHGHDAPCRYNGNFYMLMFGGMQLLLSFIPDFHDMAWLSVVAAIMSFSYSFIGLGLGFSSTLCMPTLLNGPPVLISFLLLGLNLNHVRNQIFFPGHILRLNKRELRGYV